jgi:hypothetical protein
MAVTSTQYVPDGTDEPDGPKLFVVFLGGDLPDGRIGEDHEVVFVAADDLKAARTAAKRKWRGSGRAHIDAAAEVGAVDGYRVQLVPDESSDGDEVEVNSTYVR